LGINQRYFISKEDSEEMFSAYMQEVNLKKKVHVECVSVLATG
jgi:hypothetical protein